jgi:hypothetical protein
VHSEAGSVSVRGGDGSEAVVAIRSDRDDFASHLALRVESTAPGRVEIVVERKSRGPWSWFEGDFRSKTTVDVLLPRSASAVIESSGGGISVTDLAGRVSAKSSGGGVRATNLGGPAELSSSGGAIRADGVAGDLEASSSGGGVDVRNAGGAVIADSSGGSVSVSFAPGNGRGGELGSSGGGVKAYIDPAVGLEIDAASSGGSVDCDLPVTGRGSVRRDRLNGQLQGGGALLRLRSSGGGVTIAGI